MDVLEALPDGVIIAVLAVLPLADLAAAAATCQRLHGIADGGTSGEALWKAQLCRFLSLPLDSTESQASWKALRRCALPLPLHLCSAGHTDLAIEGLRARFTGTLGGDRAVRADRRLPSRFPFAAVRAEGVRHIVWPSSFFYFEVSISIEEGLLEVRYGERGRRRRPWLGDPCISVGLATKSFLLHHKQVGWDSESLGYHGDDGHLYHGTGRLRFGPVFGAGDVVGCGVDLERREVFFSVNGVLLDSVCGIIWDRDVTLYPCVGIDSHQAVSFNFGTLPFRLNIAQAEARLRARISRQAMSNAFNDARSLNEEPQSITSSDVESSRWITVGDQEPWSPTISDSEALTEDRHSATSEGGMSATSSSAGQPRREVQLRPGHGPSPAGGASGAAAVTGPSWRADSDASSDL